MTNKEAIEILRGVKSFFGRDCVPNETPQSIDMAIAALEKQDGKKPLPVSTRSTWVKCPVCGSTDIDEYCEKCGQKILWEE